MIGRLALGQTLGDRIVRVIGDQATRTLDLVHDLVAGIDAQAAIDALHLRAIANVDAHRADHDTLLAIDTVAPALPGLALLVGAARLAPVGPVGDLQGMFVEHGSLNARPRAHIGADLLAHRSGQRIGGEGQNRDRQIGGDGGRPGKELAHQGRGVVEIEHPSPARDQSHQQPDRVLTRLAPELVERQRGRIEPHPGIAVALE